jgi:hypothetical protein
MGLYFFYRTLTDFIWPGKAEMNAMMPGAESCGTRIFYVDGKAQKK